MGAPIEGVLDCLIEAFLVGCLGFREGSMEKIEKVLLLAVLVAALLIIAVMSLFPEEKTLPENHPERNTVFAQNKDGAKERPDGLSKEALKSSREPNAQPSSGVKTLEEDGGLKNLITLEEGGEEGSGPGEAESNPLRLSPEKKALGSGSESDSLRAASQGEGGLLGGAGGIPGKTGEVQVPHYKPSFEDGGQFLRYTIQKGDAFSTILEKVCGTARGPVKELVLAANEQLNENRILAGQVLLIPKEAVELGKQLLELASKSGNKALGRSDSTATTSVVGEPRTGPSASAPTTPEVDSAVSGFAGIISLRRNEARSQGTESEGSLYRSASSAKKRGNKGIKNAEVRKESGVGVRTNDVQTYVVKKGDSFWKIASRLLTKIPGENKARRGARVHRLVQKIQDLNPAVAGGALNVGNKIRIPR
jgi:LysM repeat protein